jgi:hypothetical protein
MGGLFIIRPLIQSYLSGIPSLGLDLGFYRLILWPLSWEFVAICFVFTTLFGMIISTASTLLATQKYIK